MGCGSSSGDGSGKAAKTGNDKSKTESKDENQDFHARTIYLQKVPLMKSLPADQLPIVAGAMTSQVFPPLKRIITQGDTANEFFIIQSGVAIASVLTGDVDKEVAKLTAGDYFGENALLLDETRQASVTADAGGVTCLKMTRAKFQELKLSEQLQFVNRKAVGNGKQQNYKAKQPTNKSPQELQLISEALKGNANLSSIVKLDDDRIQKLAEVMWEEEVHPGEAVVVEGDLDAFFFYIVKEGGFDVERRQSDSSDNNSKSLNTLVSGSKVVSSVAKGGSFGELALLYLAPRAATVKASSMSTVYVIDRDQFKRLLMPCSESKVKQYVKILDTVDSLNSLIREEKAALAQELTEMHFQKDTEIVRQGEQGNTFYILYEGECDIIKDGKKISSLTAKTSHEKVEFFGELALMQSDVRAATVKVTSTTARTLTLDRAKFNELLGPLQDLMSRPASKKGPDTSSWKPGKIIRKDLSRIGLLGCGGFGTVEMYEHKQTGHTYAMKGLSKGYIVKTGMQESVMNEKSILMMTNSEFIIKLYETYNGSQSLYFLMELALGGELYATYNRKGLHGSEKHAKYYVSGVTFAFEHLHDRNVIYRDLKPENLLLTEHGHIKLTDMGLAKFVIGKTFTTCGTPDYFAPELISSSGHNKAVDWWTLGVLIFELMSGHPPFESAYPMQIYTKVMKGINKVVMPQKCQGATGELIKALLKNDPGERIAMKTGGVQNVKDHNFFSGFEWAKMKKLELPPPYVPVVKSKKDLANFCARKEDMPRQLEYHDPGTGWDKDF